LESAEARRRPGRRLKRPIVSLRFILPHRRQLQEVAGDDDLTAAKRFIAAAQPPEQELDELQLPTRKHADFVDHQHLAATDPVETRNDGSTGITL